MAAQIVNIELARNARQARETRCHYTELKPVSKKRQKIAERRAAVRQHGKGWL